MLLSPFVGSRLVGISSVYCFDSSKMHEHPFGNYGNCDPLTFMNVYMLLVISNIRLPGYGLIRWEISKTEK